MTPAKHLSRQRRARRGADRLWNTLAFLTLLATLGAALLFGWVYFNPEAPVNPFPPPAVPALAVLPSPAPTSTAVPPTATPPDPPTATSPPLPTATQTPIPPTETPVVEASPTPPPGSPSPTLKPTATPGGYAFILKGEPLAVQNIFHNDLGCNWLGVGGNIEDLRGGGKLYVTVHLHGSLNGKPVDIYTVSGAARQYGEGGYEFQLADAPAASSRTLYIQLLDQANLPLSDRIYFDTFEACDKNSIIINFEQVR